MVEFFTGEVIQGPSVDFSAWLEKSKSSFALQDGHILELKGPRVFYMPPLGIEPWVDRGTTKLYGQGALITVAYAVTATWSGTMKLIPFQDDEAGRRRLGPTIIFTNVSGKVTASDSTPPFFDLDRWGELYSRSGVRLEFSNASSGELQKVELLFTIQKPAAVQVVGSNFPL